MISLLAAVRMPTLAINGGLHVEGLAAEKQPGVFEFVKQHIHVS